MLGTWASPVYRETALIVLSFIFISGLIVYFLRKKNYYFVVSWASIKSWLVVAPILFGLLGLPEPWPLICLTVIAIFGAKVFFQLMGMFHRSYFVVICYFGILALGYSVMMNRMDVYNLLPMIVLGICCLVPLFRNNYKRMIQYISLTNLAFVFLGWSFMHLGLIMKFDKGIYQLMYLVILTEFCDNTNLAISRYIGRYKLFDRIDYKRTLEGTAVSALLTVGVAFAMRHLLPDGSEKYWLVSGLIASIGGFIGDMLMTVVRRDAGIKVVGHFILGRGDFLHRMDRLIFVAPMYYYAMMYLPEIHL
ncbi:MAG: phosphatidate cytidylyltransferase [Bdellovibrio sp. CG10_big_fil_rev_8_21_14_0_10_47_8]|nr:MAG: phosphatidate cytidylyltransferase [Bdellovibrio sp. CG10_big_fil_rev_8_21_14_0_10_47_8]